MDDSEETNSKPTEPVNSHSDTPTSANKIDSTFDTQPSTKAKRTYGFTALLIMFLCLNFTYTLSSLLLTQYGYYYNYNIMFPNSTSNGSNSDTSECTVNKSTEAYHERTAVQQETSRWSLYRTISENVPAILASVVIGPLSDKYGRKKLLILNFAISLLSRIMSPIAIHYSIDINYFILFGFLYSIGGGAYGTLSLGFAYVSDITDAGKSRTFLITILEAALGAGGAVSALVSGYVIDRFGYFFTSIFACGIQAIGLIVIIVLLPQTQVRSSGSKKMETYQNIRRAFEFYFKRSKLRKRYIIFIIVFLTAVLSNLGKPPIETLYALNAPFCWTSVKIGIFSAISSSCSQFISIGIFKLLHLFSSEESICIISSISNIAGCILEAFAFNEATLFLVPVISLLSMLTIPMVRAILSKITPPDRQGALFAGIAVVEITGNFAITAGSKAIYLATVGYFRGFTFLVYAAFSIGTIILILIYKWKFAAIGKAGFERMEEDAPI